MKNEKLTRKEIIDDRLKQAGCIDGDSSQVVEEFNIIVDANMVQEAATLYAGKQLFIQQAITIYGVAAQFHFRKRRVAKTKPY
ncbi:MAG: hypothetical protein ABI315_01270 [Bacteroidia bacterium]